MKHTHRTWCIERGGSCHQKAWLPGMEGKGPRAPVTAEERGYRSTHLGPRFHLRRRDGQTHVQNSKNLTARRCRTGSRDTPAQTTVSTHSQFGTPYHVPLLVCSIGTCLLAGVVHPRWCVCESMSAVGRQPTVTLVRFAKLAS